MSRAMRIIWLMSIACFISGCSSFGVVYGPESDELSGDLDWTEFVKSGESVRVTLANDRTIEGKAVRVWADSLGVKTERRGFLGRRESTGVVTITTEEELVSIEKRQFSNVKTLGLLALLIAAPIVAFAVSFDSPHTGFQ